MQKKPRQRLRRILFTIESQNNRNQENLINQENIHQKPPLFGVRKSHAKIALFQKCALSDYWEEDDLDSFLKFLVHEKLTLIHV